MFSSSWKGKESRMWAFSFSFSYWMLFKVSECFLLGTFTPYFRRDWVICHVFIVAWPHLIFELFLRWNHLHFTLEIAGFAWKYNFYIFPFTFALSPFSSGQSAAKAILRSNSECGILRVIHLHLRKFTITFVVRNGSLHHSPARFSDSPMNETD